MRTPIPMPMAVPITNEVIAAHNVGLMIGPRMEGAAGGKTASIHINC